MAISDEFLDETIRVWQPYSKEPLTREDAREIAENFVGLFETLMECAQERKEKEKKSNLPRVE